MPRYLIFLATVTIMFVVIVCGSNQTKQASRVQSILEGQCYKCHGLDGSGKTPVGIPLRTPDLRTGKLKQGNSKAQIAQTILNGVPGTAMVGFKAALTEHEAKQIATIVKGWRNEE